MAEPFSCILLPPTHCNHGNMTTINTVIVAPPIKSQSVANVSSVMITNVHIGVVEATYMYVETHAPIITDHSAIVQYCIHMYQSFTCSVQYIHVHVHVHVHANRAAPIRRA